MHQWEIGWSTAMSAMNIWHKDNTDIKIEDRSDQITKDNTDIEIDDRSDQITKDNTDIGIDDRSDQNHRTQKKPRQMLI
jgi:hypothetical protein